jgi:GTPase SAR1 family protein
VSVPAPIADPNAVRVVFFGPPRSGKTTLLYACTKYAERGAEEAPVDLTAADPNVVQRELVPLRLLVDLPGPRAETGAVLFLDCDGQAALDLLNHADRLKRKAARTALAEAIHSADALVLVIDSGCTQVEVESTFQSFEQFLEVLESTRTDDREVGGLPVFLTLTKCDTLHHPTDEPSEWLTRIERRKQELREWFNEWFDPPGEVPAFLTFGSMDIRTHATATKVPGVAGMDPYADEVGGLGVVELFQSVYDASRQHRDRSTSSRKRLKWTAAIAVGLLGVMLVTLFGLTVSRPPGPVEALTNRAVRFQQRMGPPAVRLSEANFERNQREINALRESPVFPQLPDEWQKFVIQEVYEFAAYADYRRRFQPPQFSPADVRTADDYAQLLSEIDRTLAPPPEFERSWSQTEMVKLRDKWRADLKLLQEAEDQVHAWFRGQVSRASELMLANVPTDTAPTRWRTEVNSTLSQRPPFDMSATVPGSVALPVRRGSVLTYATVYQFERSANARRDWEQAIAKLSDLRDLTDAVGLTVDPEYIPAAGEPLAVLDLPPVGNGADSLRLATHRLAALKKRFPKAAEGAANWTAENFSGPLRDELGRRLRLAAAEGVSHVQRLIRSEGNRNSRPDSLTDWASLATPTGLLAKPELQDWGRLLRLLLRWADPNRPDVDPVSEFAAFVKKERFEWTVGRLDVTLPNALRVRVLKPTGDWKLTVTPPSGPPRITTFSAAGSPEVMSDAVTYRFAPTLEGIIAYRPGEGFTAELPLTDGDTKYVLRWTDSRTVTYQFEKLTREPVIVPDGPGAVPQQATGVRVTVAPDATTFRVPELLPDVK